MSYRSRQIELASRPSGWPELSNFRLGETEVPEPGQGQIVVRNLVMSVDPYMRGRMNEVKTYIEPYTLGAALEGGAIGEVVASEAAGLSKGDIVLHSAGWREYALLDAGTVEKVPADEAPLGAYLGVLGMPGLTAYVGVHKVAEVRAGDTVWVSGAAGAVGQVAGQLAKIGGARVIGSAGSAEKVALLTERLGFDTAFDYHEGRLKDQVAKAAPDGLDVYFDNVGGEHLEAAIGAANLHARFALCGASSTYNLPSASQPAPRNLVMVLQKRLKLQGLLVFDYEDIRDEFIATVTPLVNSGRLVYDETVFEGLENAPEALLAILDGKTTGKALVRIAS